MGVPHSIMTRFILRKWNLDIFYALFTHTKGSIRIVGEELNLKQDLCVQHLQNIVYNQRRSN